MELSTILKLVTVGAIGAASVACDALPSVQTPSLPAKAEPPKALESKAPKPQTYQDGANAKKGDKLLYRPGSVTIPAHVNIRGTSLDDPAAVASKPGTQLPVAVLIRNPVPAIGVNASGGRKGDGEWLCGESPATILGQVLPREFSAYGCIFYGPETEAQGSLGAPQVCDVKAKYARYIECTDGTHIGQFFTAPEDPLPKTKAGRFGNGS